MSNYSLDEDVYQACVNLFWHHRTAGEQGQGEPASRAEQMLVQAACSALASELHTAASEYRQSIDHASELLPLSGIAGLACCHILMGEVETARLAIGEGLPFPTSYSYSAYVIAFLSQHVGLDTLARQRYRKLAAMLPHDLAIYCEIAIGLARANDWALAGRLVRRAETEFPHSPKSLLLLARAYLALGRPAKARRTLEKVDLFYSNETEAYACVSALGDGGSASEALKLIRKAVKWHPHSYLLLMLRGALLCELDRPSSAEAAYVRAGRLLSCSGEGVQGTRSSIDCEIGIIRLRCGDFGRARDALHRAIEDDPDNIIALFYLGEAAYRLGDAREAAACWEKVSQSDQPEWAFVANLAKCQANTHEPMK